jgi:hypothetical protein
MESLLFPYLEKVNGMSLSHFQTKWQLMTYGHVYKMSITNLRAYFQKSKGNIRIRTKTYMMS